MGTNKRGRWWVTWHSLFNVGVDCCGPIIEYLKKWYFDNNVPKEERSQIVIRAKPYTLYDGQLYKLGLDGVLWQCLFLEKAFKILKDFHEGLVGGHFGMNNIVRNIFIQTIGGPLCINMLLNYIKILTFANV
jgi:hypothetical protein